MLSGVMTALVTPFTNNQVDVPAIKKLVDYQMTNGVSAIVPCGTTGEAATLNDSERDLLLETILERVNGKINVIAGVGTNNTNNTVQLAKRAEQLGASHALVVTPYYNKPTQNGAYEHFKAVSENISIPIILYNVPSRTGFNLEPDTVARLAELNNIVAVKEATASMSQACEILLKCPSDFSLLSGDDFTFLPLMSIGGSGIISVVSNVAPAGFVELYNSYINKDLETAKQIQMRLWGLMKSMFVSTNPVPVKAALTLMGFIKNELRLPLIPLEEKYTSLLSKELCKQELIK